MLPEDLQALIADNMGGVNSALGASASAEPARLPLQPWDTDAALNPADYGMVPEGGHQPDQYVTQADPMLAASPQAVAAGEQKRLEEERAKAFGLPAGSMPIPGTADILDAVAKAKAAGVAAGAPAAGALAPGQSASSGTSSSQSSSHTGVNQGTFENFDTGKPASRFDKRVANAKDVRIAEANAMNENIGQGFQEQEDANRARAAVDVAAAATRAGDPAVAAAAVNEMASAVGLAGKESTGLSQMAVAQASIAAKEQEETAKALAKAETARANYTEQVNRVKAMKIDPFQLIGNDPLAYGLQNATSMMMMISGKPGMQQAGKALQDGILNTINKSVDAQMANMQNQQNVSAGFKQIYDMVVDENDTSTVARNKVYGAYLASMEAMVESEMGQHDSQIINAQLGQTIAGLHTQRAGVENQNYSDALKMAQDDAKIFLDKYKSDQAASVERAQIAESRAGREAAATAKAQDRTDKMLANLANGVSISPFDSDEGAVAGITKDDDNSKTLMAQSSVAASRVIQLAEELRALNVAIEKEGDPGNWLNVGGLNTELKKRADVIKTDLAYQLAKIRDPKGIVAKGDQASAEAAISTNPRDWFRSDGTGSVDVVIKQARKQWEETSQQYMKSPELYNEAERSFMSQRRQGYDPETVGKDERFKSNLRDKEALHPDPDTPARVLKKTILDVTHQDSTAIPLNAPTAVGALVESSVPDWYFDYAKSDGGRFYDGQETLKRSEGGAESIRYPEWGQELYNLAARAHSGEKDAVDELTALAGMDTSGQFAEQAEMAQYFLTTPATMENTSYKFRNALPVAEELNKGRRAEEAYADPDLAAVRASLEGADLPERGAVRAGLGNQ